MVFYVWSLVSNGLASGAKYFGNQQFCGLGDSDRHLRVAQQLWERVGGIFGSRVEAERERETEM